MTTPDGVPNYNIAVVGRAFDLLEALASAREPLGVSELARAVGSTKSATFRILATLEGRGYVTRDADTARYKLGIGLLFFGQRALEDIDLRSEARPVLEELHNRFNETVNLGVIINDKVIYLDILESEHGLRMTARAGSQDEIHSTAIGKAILSHWPEYELARFLESPLTKRTSRTITDPLLLRKELDQIRTAGISQDKGENEEGASCFGAPIFDHQGEVVAAISISGPESRLAGETAHAAAQAVADAAAMISTRLGGRRQRLEMKEVNGSRNE